MKRSLNTIVRVVIMLFLVFNVDSSMIAQRCTGIKSIGGLGTQDAIPFVRNGSTYLLGHIGNLVDGRPSKLSIDGHTLLPNIPEDAVLEGDGYDYDYFPTFFYGKLNPDNSLAWIMKQHGNQRDKRLSYSGCVVDEEGNSYLYLTSNKFKGGFNFGGTILTSHLDYGAFIIKISSNGEILWYQSFLLTGGSGDTPSLIMDDTGNLCLFAGFSYTANFEFKLNGWSDDQKIYTDDNDEKGWHIFRFNPQSGELLSHGNVLDYFAWSTASITPYTIRAKGCNGFLGLALSYYDPDDSKWKEKFLIEKSGKHHIWSSEDEYTTSVLYNADEDVFYRFAQSDKNAFSSIQKISTTSFDTIQSAKFNRTQMFPYTLSNSNLSPALDSEGNIIFRTTNVWNRSDERATTYNGESLYIPERGSGNSERLIYIDKDLNLIGQSYLRYKDDYDYIGAQVFYCPGSNTLKSVGSLRFRTILENSEAFAIPPDTEFRDIGLFEFEHNLIFPKIENCTLIRAKTFTVQKGEKKELSFAFDNKDPLNYSWRLDGVEVSTENTYTFDGDKQGEFTLRLQVSNPKRPDQSFIKTWDLNVSDLEAVKFLPESNPMYNNRYFDRLLSDTIRNGLWAVEGEHGSQHSIIIHYFKLDSLDKVKTINLPDDVSLDNGEIISLESDEDGDIWILTENAGILRYKNNAWIRTSATTAGFSGDPRKLYFDGRSMFVGTNEGLWRYDDAWSKVEGIALTNKRTPRTSYGESWPGPSSSVRSMASAGEDQMWIGLESGIIEFNSKDSIFPMLHEMPFNTAHAIAESGDCLYFGNAVNGLVEYNKTSKTFHYFYGFKEQDYNFYASSIFCIKSDKDGKLWFLDENYNYGDGIYCLDPESRRITHHLKGTTVNTDFEITPDNNIYFISSGYPKKVGLPRPNTAPISKAWVADGQQRKVGRGDTVRLDGTQSFDTDGDSLSYHWFSENEEIQIIDSSSPNAKFIAWTAPIPNDIEPYTLWKDINFIYLVVSDGITSDTSMVDIGVKANVWAPIVEINDRWHVDEGKRIQLSVSKAYDPDLEGLDPLTYSVSLDWKIDDNSLNINTSSDSASLIFDAPYVKKDTTILVYVRGRDAYGLSSDWVMTGVSIRNVYPSMQVETYLQGSPVESENVALYFINSEDHKGINASPLTGTDAYALYPGKWKVYAIPVDMESHNFIPSYAQSSAISSDAQEFVLGDESELSIRMDLIPYGILSGVGSISGKVNTEINGAIVEEMARLGVVIYSLPDTIPVSFTRTDEDGKYTFGALEVGKYLIAFDFPGMPLSQGIVVEITASQPSVNVSDITLNPQTGIDEISDDAWEIVVFPNPSTNMVYLKGLTDRARYQIYSISGVCVKTGSCTQQIPISDLDKGMYLLKINTGSTWKSMPLVKQ